MTLMTGQQYRESLRKRRPLKVFFDGKLLENPMEHPSIKSSVNSVALTYELALDPEYTAADDGEVGAHRRNHQPFLPFAPKHRRPNQQSPHAATARSALRHVLPTLRRHGCTQRRLFNHIRNRQKARHQLPRALPQVRSGHGEERLGRRRLHDGRQRRPRQAARRIDRR